MYIIYLNVCNLLWVNVPNTEGKHLRVIIEDLFYL